jgi:hypothetical protein
LHEDRINRGGRSEGLDFASPRSEEIMAKGIQPRTSAELVATSGLRIPPILRCLATDRIDMEYVWAVDPELGAQLTAVGLEADSAVLKTMADATAQAAKMMKSLKQKS